ncbi:hypothetical protein PSHT_01306 [Puccinia striiformis]|uniref:Uncharacterized protein n=1 Tax=Puccinia striiformis TaxID=27350 RepID=A0A2S4WKQ6_9BASI|nr:hypothetical protein PSHT_01306 [Puccinia striiformis]
MSETNNLENPLLAVGAVGNNLPANLGSYRDRVDSPDSSNHGLPIGGQLPTMDAQVASPPLATHPYGTPVYAAEAWAVPHFLESRIALPKYNREPFGHKPVKIKTQNLQGVMFNGTNMEIGDFITRVERAAQLNSAQGSDICLQIVFFMQGEALAKEVQEMMTNVEDIRHIVLTCIERPIRITVTKELIRDNQMQQAIDGSHILPSYCTIMEYIGRELKTMSILDIKDWSKEPPKAQANTSRASQMPQAPQILPQDRAMEDLTKTLSGWNVQQQPGFASASHVLYKPAQYERPPSSLKCHYCFGDGHTLYRCNLFSQDEFNKEVYREGKTTSSQTALASILTKDETPAEVQSSFGKLEECEPSRVASYEADMANCLRGGKEIPDTPSAKKTRRDDEEDMDVDDEIMAIANKDYDPFPGYKEALAEKEKNKKSPI